MNAIIENYKRNIIQIASPYGTGTGFYNADSHLFITNYHVIKDNDEVIISGRGFKKTTAKVLYFDPLYDLAFIQAPENIDLQKALLSSVPVSEGDNIIAIGHPYGLKYTATKGIVSKASRLYNEISYIQIDAAINPGNSGGALANADGEVVGINSIKIAVGGVEGIGFAIPMNTARPIIQALIEKGRVARPYLGVVAFDKNTAERYGYQLNINKGLYVFRLVLNSPADRAGIRVGDVILKLAGQETNSLPELRSVIEAQGVGATIAVTVSRNGEQFDVQAKLSEVPNE